MASSRIGGESEALATAASTNVEIGGHTDAKGSDDYNQRLSDRRACSVGRYLKGKGIEEGRMTPVGYGESKPIADNETDEGREQNRRVELRILEGAGAGLGACASATVTRAAPAPAHARRACPALVPVPARAQPVRRGPGDGHEAV